MSDCADSSAALGERDRGIWRPLWRSEGRSQLILLILTSAAAMYARSALGPLQESIRVDLGLSDTRMAILQGPALAVPMLVLWVPIGRVVDRYSRAVVMRLLTALCLMGTIASALAPSFTLLAGARCILGLAAPAIWVAAVSFVSDTFGPAHRGMVVMLLTVAQWIGESTAFLVGGFALAASSGLGEGWRLATIMLGLPVLVVLALTYRLREPPRSRMPAQENAAGSIRALLRHRAVLQPIIGGLSMLGIADGAAVTWTAPTLSRSFRISPATVGAIVAAVLLVGGALGPVLGGFMADKCQESGGPRRTMTAASILALITIPLGCFAIVPSIVGSAVMLAGFIALGAMIVIAGIAVLTIAIPAELRGTCMALLSASYLVVSFGIAPLSVSWLAAAMGGLAKIGEALSAVSVGSSIIGSAMLLVGVRLFWKMSATTRTVQPTLPGGN